MTVPSSSGGSDQSLLPLLLFTLTAKLYIDHHNRQKQQRQAIAMTTETRGEDDASYHHDTDYSPDRHQEEQQQQRRLLMRHLRLSIDSPDFSEHHFYESTNHRSIVREGLPLPCLPSIHDNDNDNDDDDDGEVLLKDCPRWRKLMQRVSIADSVLTRVRKKSLYLQKIVAALAKHITWFQNISYTAKS